MVSYIVVTAMIDIMQSQSLLHNLHWHYRQKFHALSPSVSSSTWYGYPFNICPYIHLQSPDQSVQTNAGSNDIISCTTDRQSGLDERPDRKSLKRHHPNQSCNCCQQPQQQILQLTLILIILDGKCGTGSARGLNIQNSDKTIWCYSLRK
jgi:hypothetical protein